MDLYNFKKEKSPLSKLENGLEENLEENNILMDKNTKLSRS